MVDTVSGLGSELLSPEEWGIDIGIAGPQKCLSGPPGLALLSVSPAAWEAMEQCRNPLRGSYLSILDWKTTWLEKRTLPVYAARLRDVCAGVGPDARCSRRVSSDWSIGISRSRGPAGQGSRRSGWSFGRRARRSPRRA